MAKQKQQKLIGAQAFDAYYSAVYGERWNSLKASFSEENIHVQVKQADCEPYFLDPASVCAALTLPLDNASNVLDLCAAPGGKTLLLALNKSPDAVLYSNERSMDRKKRLDLTVKNCLDAHTSGTVITSCSDGSLWCKKQTECYDAILLDAPCSSERHVFLDSRYLDVWTENRVKTLAMEQWALLSCAWRLLVPGGYMVYSTCALADRENDQIIQRLVKKFQGVEVQSVDFMKQTALEAFNGLSNVISNDNAFSLEQLYSSAEPTDYGLHILPDNGFGCGPLYFCLLQKTRSVKNIDL